MPTVFFGKTFYSTKEACQRIERCKNTVLNWIYTELEPDVKINERGNREWTDEDIQRFIKRRELVKKNRKTRAIKGEGS